MTLLELLQCGRRRSRSDETNLPSPFQGLPSHIEKELLHCAMLCRPLETWQRDGARANTSSREPDDQNLGSISAYGVISKRIRDSAHQ